MKVLIYGGSFNPIHNGHIQLLKEINSFYFFNEIWIIPNSLDANKIFLSDEERINLIKEDLKDFKNLKILNIELNQNKPVVTFKTIKILKEKYPNNIFYFLIGSDQFLDLKNWEGINKLSQNINFIVGSRKNYTFNQRDEKNYNSIIHKCDIVDYSSTLVRNGNLKHVSITTKKYLQKNLNFLKMVVKNNTNEKRYNHSLCVAEKAKELALIYDSSLSKKAYISGLLHDVFKNKTYEEMKKYFINADSKWINEHKNTWHQIAGASFLNQNKIVEDQEIICAIKKHTTAAEEMSLLDKIVYVADKISDDRSYEGVEELRLMAQKDINICFVNIFRGVCEKIKKEIKISDLNRRLIKKWIKK